MQGVPPAGNWFWALWPPAFPGRPEDTCDDAGSALRLDRPGRYAVCSRQSGSRYAPRWSGWSYSGIHAPVALYALWDAEIRALETRGYWPQERKPEAQKRPL